MNELELKVLQLIREVYNREYVGKLSVTKNNYGYILKLYLGNPDGHPLVIAADSETAEDFLEFLKKEFISRQLIKVQYFKGVKKEIYDQGRTC